MDKRWFVTAGEQGGEYALKAATTDDAHKVYEKAFGRSTYLRPTPPDLVEWLEAELHSSSTLDRGACLSADARTNVPGGWLYFGGAGESAAAAFVPVRGADGITVLTSEE